MVYTVGLITVKDENLVFNLTFHALINPMIYVNPIGVIQAPATQWVHVYECLRSNRGGPHKGQHKVIVWKVHAAIIVMLI